MALNAVGGGGCLAGIKLCRKSAVVGTLQGPKNTAPIRKWLKIFFRSCQFEMVFAILLLVQNASCFMAF